jgi:hypothetical protein
MAAPQYAAFQFRGASGRVYSKDAYLSDVVAGLVNWDSGQGAGATSETFWTPPENVVLVDYSQVTGLTDTTKIALTRNGVNTGDILRYTIHLTTLAYRPVLRTAFPAGSKISAIQLA